MEMGEKFMSTKDFASFVGVSAATAYRWQNNGIGPDTVVVGGKEYYTHSLIREWQAAKRRRRESVHARPVRKNKIQQRCAPTQSKRHSVSEDLSEWGGALSFIRGKGMGRKRKEKKERKDS